MLTWARRGRNCRHAGRPCSYKNGLALITDMTDAANVKLEAELALVSARINLAYCYYRLKYACQCL